MVKRKNYNWNKIRKEFQESDLTYSAFSTEKGIPKSTAYAHLKDLIALKNSTSNDNTDDDSSEGSFDFVPIEVLEAEAVATAEEVTFIQIPEEAPILPKDNFSPFTCELFLHEKPTVTGCISTADSWKVQDTKPHLCFGCKDWSRRFRLFRM